MTIQKPANKDLFFDKNEEGMHSLAAANKLGRSISSELGLAVRTPRLEELLAIRSTLAPGIYWCYGGVGPAPGVFDTKNGKFFKSTDPAQQARIRFIRRPELDAFHCDVVTSKPDTSTLFGFALTIA